MKVRTREQLVDLLDNDLSWRKKELTFIKGNIIPSKPNYKTHLRTGILILYAHWEGFIKNACEIYLSYIKFQRLKYNELKENFIAYSLKSQLKNFQQTNKSTVHTQIVDFIVNKRNERAVFPVENSVNTASNLNSKILCEILTTVGLNYDTYELKNNLIDNVLLKNRNSIAHGQYVELTDVDYKNLHKEVLWMMDDIKTNLSNAVVLEKYKINTV